MHAVDKFAFVLLTTCAIRNPSGMTYSHTALDLLLRKLSIILLRKIIPPKASCLYTRSERRRPPQGAQQSCQL